MTPREHAAGLVDCFTKYILKEDDPVNGEHLRVASEWLRLIDAKNPAVADIEALQASLDTLGDAGSASIDLKIGVRAWAPGARRRAIMRRDSEE